MEHLIDAKQQRVGRLASKIAVILQGKTHPQYDPRKIGADRVVVTNAGKMEISGRKYDKKIYYHHTGYMGHLRKKTYAQKFEKSPSELLRLTIYNMLPKNRLRAKRLNKLVIYDGENNGKK